MSQSEDRFVLPGDVIVTGSYRPEQNVVLDDDRVTATAVGFYEIEDKVVNVTPLTGFYTPKPDDLVIGKIVSHTSFSWEVSTKIPRLIGKHGSMIQTIEAATNATITVGQNGLIILKCDNSVDLKKAIEAIKIMDSMLDDTNIEEKIQNILDENN